MLLYPNSLPSIFLQQPITFLISYGLVPILSIHLKSNVNRRNRKVYTIPADLKLLNKVDLHSGKTLSNPFLNARLALVASKAGKFAKRLFRARHSSKAILAIMAVHNFRRATAFFRTEAWTPSRLRRAEVPIASLTGIPFCRNRAAGSTAVDTTRAGRLLNPKRHVTLWAHLKDVATFNLCAVFTHVATKALFLPTQVWAKLFGAPLAHTDNVLVSTAGTLLNCSGGLVSYLKYTTYA